MTDLVVGDEAPDFDLEDDSGNRVRLADLRGRSVVLYFYPKDDTPGCTTESCEFRDAHAVFAAKNAVILGVSPDSVASHAKFKQKFSLNFPLLADEGAKVARAYGAWGPRLLYGRLFEGILRSTFVIGPDGRFTYVNGKVRPKGHAAQVLDVFSS